MCERYFSGMALDSFTAQKLYENGIIDYIPLDLISNNPIGAGMAGLNGQQYLNSAMQGNLYSSYGNSCDSFTSTNHINLNSTTIGNKSNVNANALGFFGIGNKSTAGSNGFGQNGIGQKSNLSFESANGGFNDVRDNINSAKNSLGNIPKPIWGLLSFAIGAFALVSIFKGRKKPEAEGFFSRIVSRFKHKN